MREEIKEKIEAHIKEILDKEHISTTECALLITYVRLKDEI